MSLIYIHSGKWVSNSPCTTFTTNTVYGIAQNNAPVIFISRKNTDKEPKKVLEEYFGYKENENLTIDLIDAPNCTLFYIKAFLKVLNYSKTISVEKVISRNLSFVPYLFFLKLIKGIAVYFESHDFFITTTNFRKKIFLKKSLYEKYLIPLISGVICISESQSALYKKHINKNKVFTAITGAPEIEYVSKENFTYTIGYIGAVSGFNYNIENLIKAISLSNKNVNLLIIGGKDKNEISNINNLFNKYSIENRSKITGWLSPIDMKKRMKEFDIGFAVIGHIATPLKVLDYISLGIPVISEKKPGIEGLIEDNISGYILKDANIKTWVDAINFAFDDFEKFLNIRKNCIVLAKKISWKNRGKVLIDL